MPLWAPASPVGPKIIFEEACGERYEDKTAHHVVRWCAVETVHRWHEGRDVCRGDLYQVLVSAPQDLNPAHVAIKFVVELVQEANPLLTHILKSFIALVHLQ